MSEKNIVYLEVCYGKTNSICIRATKKLKKADAQYYTINDALRLGFEKLNVTRVIVLSKEEAYSAFDLYYETASEELELTRSNTKLGVTLDLICSKCNGFSFSRILTEEEEILFIL